VALPAQTSRVQARYDGSGALTVSAINMESNETRVLVSTTAPYSGTTLITGTAEYAFEIVANSDWSLEVEAVPLSEESIQVFGNTGDAVSNFFMPERTGRVPYMVQHMGNENFRVLLRCAESEQVLIEESGQVSQQVLANFDAGPCLWAVTADGEWQISPP
jgi:hypothetical protein